MSDVLYGKQIADEILLDLKSKIATLARTLTLAIIQVGDDERSSAYIRQKKLFAEKIGVKVEHVELARACDMSQIKKVITELNVNPKVNGIIVQLSLPQNIDQTETIECIDPTKDVDGLTSHNVKMLWDEKKGIAPATARGVLTLLDYYKIPLQGKNALVIGRSSLVGKPIALALLKRNATVTIAHKMTKNLPEIARRSELVVIAAGSPWLLRKEWTNKNQIIVDVGINLVLGTSLEEKIPKRRLVGDADFNSILDHVKAITPVPGGVGPLTVASLFQNLLDAYEERTE